VNERKVEDDAPSFFYYRSGMVAAVGAVHWSRLGSGWVWLLGGGLVSFFSFSFSIFCLAILYFLI
jgi:hypothetical protein